MKKVTLNDIPSISIEKQDNVLDLALNILANGEKAKIFISQGDHVPVGGDEKIVIVWDTPNKIYGESFTTKYFLMDEPGLLTWGHDHTVITVEFIS